MQCSLFCLISHMNSFSSSLPPVLSSSAPCSQLRGRGHEHADGIGREGERRGTRRGGLLATKQPRLLLRRFGELLRASGPREGRTEWEEKGLHGGGGVVKRVDPQTVNLTPFFSKDTPPRISGPTPTIVRPGSLPLHLGFDALQPTMPSPTSVITQAPPSNRNLG